MIISEKQIMQLITLVRHSLQIIPKNECPTLIREMWYLLHEIEMQQSEELKEIS